MKRIVAILSVLAVFALASKSQAFDLFPRLNGNRQRAQARQSHGHVQQVQKVQVQKVQVQKVQVVEKVVVQKQVVVQEVKVQKVVAQVYAVQVQPVQAYYQVQQVQAYYPAVQQVQSYSSSNCAQNELRIQALSRQVEQLQTAELHRLQLEQQRLKVGPMQPPK